MSSPSDDTESTPETESLPTVDPAPLLDRDPGEFTDEELDLPYALEHFHRIANAVREEGEHRGFIDLPVWRRNEGNEPYNARIMESILTLAYFYTADRPWNPYRGDPGVRSRLEAALDYWVGIQNDDGRFAEETLLLLADEDVPGIDDDLRERVTEAHRRTIVLVLDPEKRDDASLSSLG